MSVRLRAAAAGVCTASLLAATAAAAQTGPAGIWTVEKGDALIRIVDCGGRYWGVVAWEKTPGVDSHNPDAALRSRPTLGIPVLLGMHPDGQGTWSGRIYNADDGQVYDSHIKLTGADTLRVEGCVLGIMCGGETWRRSGAGAAVAENRRASGRATTGVGRGRRSIADEPTAQVCSSLGRR